MKFNKMIINFSLEKSFYSVEEFIDYWSLTYKNCVNGAVYIVIICTLYQYDAFD